MQQNEDGASVGGAGGHKHEVPEPVRKKACTKPTPAQTPTRPSHDSRTYLTCVPRRTCLLRLPAAILLRFRVTPNVAAAQRLRRNKRGWLARAHHCTQTASQARTAYLQIRRLIRRTATQICCLRLGRAQLGAGRR